jgi:DNA-directed RNA polymerase specialized sigma24 family protein
MKKFKRKYISNKDLLPEVIKFKENGIASEELGSMLLSIGYKYATKGNFANYTWIDDMVSDAVQICLKYLKNFDPKRQKKPNPFAYITTIFRHAFINYIKQQGKHSQIKDTCYQKREILFDCPTYSNKGIDYQRLQD